MTSRASTPTHTSEPTLNLPSPEEFAKLDPRLQAQLLPLIQRHADLTSLREARTNFYKYCQRIDKSYIKGKHLELLTTKLQGVVDGSIRRLIVCMPPRHPVWEEHRVLMSDGSYRPVRDLQVGDQVITHEGRPGTIQQVHVQGELPTLRIRTHHGRELFVHDTHPMWTPEGWVSAGDLKVKQCLGVINQPTLTPTSAARWSDIYPATVVDVPLVEAATLLGYVTGDGSVASGRSVGMTIDTREEQQVEEVARLAAACGWALTKRKARFSFGINNTSPEQRGRGTAQWFREAGVMGSDAYTKHVPEWLFRAPAAAQLGFLSGLFTTDGSVATRGYGRDDRCVSFASVSHALLVGVQSLLLRFGVTSRLRTRVAKINTARQGDTYTGYVLEITTTTDAARLINQLHVPHSKRTRFPDTYQQEFKGKWTTDQILAIDRVEPRRHRCFTIPGDESFTIEDVGVHNSKSRHASELFPGYYLGHYPDAPVMTLSHTLSLSKKFGRSVRDYIASPEYHTLFPETQLRSDQTAVGEWGTTRGAQFFAAGVGGAIAGRGARLLVVDDMVTDQDALQGQTRPEVFEGIYDWYLLARQRLMPGGSIVIVNTRWAPNDPTGLILERSKEDWEVITLPAVWPQTEEEVTAGKTERTLWPEFWAPQEIFALRDEMPPLKWEATYQQNPTAGGATIVQPEWIKQWPSPTPPKLTELIITVDGAFSEKERADPSGILIGGIFEAARGQPGGRDMGDALDRPLNNAIVLDYIDTRQNFPDLKTTIHQLYTEFQPDVILIEDKATGVPLFQELALLNLPVSLFKVARGTRAAPNDKISRYTSVSSVIEAGRFWVPHPDHCEWSAKFQTTLTNFPMVSNDEAVDCVTMLLTYFRNLGMLTLPKEERPEDNDPDSQRPYRFGGYVSAVRGR